MRKLLYLLMSLALAISSEVRAEPSTDCRLISESGTVQGPSQADLVRVTDLDGRTLARLEFTITGGQWTPDQDMVSKIQGALEARADERESFRLQWFRGETKIETDCFVMPGEDCKTVCPPPKQLPPGEAIPIKAQPTDDTSVGASDAQDQCKELFREWNNGIEARLGGHDRYLTILFGPDGQILAENKDYGVAGDLIYTAVCQDERSVSSPVVKFTKCDLQSAIPKNPEGDKFVQQNEGVVKMRRIEFPVRQCFGASAEVKVTIGKITETHPIGLYERYRYTLQVAVLNTDQHVHAFGLRKDGGVSKIFDKGPIDNGPEYSASIVLYALPRYISHLFPQNRERSLSGLEALASRTYQGRDVVNDHALSDRIGLVFGAGLDHPRDRFAVGLSFELVPGVNLVGVYESAKLKELSGTEEGAVFAGTAEEIPQTDVWNRKVVFGFSLDMRYVAGLFKRGT